MNIAEARGLLDIWVSIYDAIREEELTIAAMNLDHFFNSKYIEELEIQLDDLEPRMGKELIVLAQCNWSWMRMAHLTERDDPDYEKAQIAYRIWREKLDEAIAPILDRIPGPSDPVVEYPVSNQPMGDTDSDEDLPF